MIFDTDIIIWLEHGSHKAEQLVDGVDKRYISIQTYMEFLQGARSKAQVYDFKDFLERLDFQVLPITENISHRAGIYIEEYAMNSGVRAGDALIAATAIENNLKLATGNHKHFKSIVDLKIEYFNP